MAPLIGLDSTSSGFDPGLQDPPITFGVWGDSGDADGVIGSSNTGVGVFGRSIAAGATAVRGSSQNGTGVDATSARGTAVHARRDPGGGAAVTAAFLATPSLAADFRGDVATSGAVRVGGRLEAAGVIGSSDTGVGVLGRSIDAGAAAVRGSSENGTGVDATSTGGTAVHARCGAGGGAAVTEAFLATPSLAADFRGDVATSGAVRVGGRLGAGSTAPRAAVGIRGVSGAEELLSFEDSSGVPRWHVNQKLTGRSGLNFAETGVADGNGRLYLQAGGNVGVGTTAPTHPLHVAKVQGIRQNELYLSGARIPSVSYNAHLNEAGDGWVFPDPSRPAVTVQMYDSDGNPRFEVYSTTRQNPTGWVPRLLVDGQSGVVSIPNGQLNVSGGVTATNPSGYGIRAAGSIGMDVKGPVGMVASSTSGGYAGTFNGDVRVTGTLSKGGSNFEIDHPLDPANKLLQHSGIECDEMKNLYDGVVDLDAHGRAEVVVPDWFEALNQNFRYQLTPIGAAAPDLHIADELRDGRFTVAGGPPNTKVCWQVSGVRHDAYAQAHPLQVEALKSSEEAGLFLHPEEHHQPAERSLATLVTAPANDSVQG